MHCCHVLKIRIFMLICRALDKMAKRICTLSHTLLQFLVWWWGNKPSIIHEIHKQRLTRTISCIYFLFATFTHKYLDFPLLTHTPASLSLISTSSLHLPTYFSYNYYTILPIFCKTIHSILK